MSFAEAHSFVLADPTRNELTFGLLAVVKNFDSQQNYTSRHYQHVQS
jgi:hypothetical protein